jgi:hypothetical protein
MMAQSFRPALLDAAHKYHVRYTVVFRSAHDDRPQWNWLWRMLRPGMQHVELWKFDEPTLTWTRLDTALEFISVETYAQGPRELIPKSDNPTFVQYERLLPHGFFRQPFRLGPSTCVELAAAVLGVRLPWYVRTPHQFYRLITKREKAENRNAH